MSKNYNLKEILVPVHKLAKLSLYLTIFLLTIFFSSFYFINGWEILKSGLYDFFFSWYTILAVIVGIVSHEMIHLLVFILFGQVSLKSLTGGINKALMSPYIHVKSPVKIGVYRLSALAPAILLGIVPIGMGFYLSNVWYIIFGIIFTVGAIADLYMFWQLRKYNSDTFVLDHDQKPGCFILID